MKTSSLRLAALVLVAMVYSTQTYAADKANTTRAMVRLSPKAANEKARRDLLSILQPTGRFNQGNRIRVSGMRMNTVPYGAGLKGLCRMDELFLVYGSTATGRASAVDPLQPMGVEAQPLFHAIDGPVTEFSDPFFRPVVRNGDCMKLRSDKSLLWFSAADGREAARGVNMVLAAAAAIRSGQLKAKDCDSRQFGMTCEEKILQIGRAGELLSVTKGCAAGPQQECYNVMIMGNIELTIVATFEDDQSISPTKIESVSAAQYVVVT